MFREDAYAINPKSPNTFPVFDSTSPVKFLGMGTVQRLKVTEIKNAIVLLDIDKVINKVKNFKKIW